MGSPAGHDPRPHPCPEHSLMSWIDATAPGTGKDCNRNVTVWSCCSAGGSMDVVLLIVWGKVV